jgi:predicted membrane GTPase involved in stress response
VILQEKEGIKCEPLEELTIYVPEECISEVTQEVGSRRGN